VADKVTVWSDAEADYLEVQFKCVPRHMKETTHDSLMERVDAEGNVIGFSILGVSRFTKEKPLQAELSGRVIPFERDCFSQAEESSSIDPGMGFHFAN
jgi:uncharacterized protein YuzE